MTLCDENWGQTAEQMLCTQSELIYSKAPLQRRGWIFKQGRTLTVWHPHLSLGFLLQTPLTSHDL